jgi:predicted transcriptional regulator of viral defense system
MASRVQIAKSDIIKHFDSLPQRVYRQAEIARILFQQRDFWRLAQSLTVQGFIKFMLESTKMEKVEFSFPTRNELRYIWGKASLYEMALTLRPDCYLSHYTAVRLHGLTEQVPKTVYVNAEQTPKPTPNGELAQSRIDFAFRSSPRVSNNIAEVGDFRVCLLNGMHTGNLGVQEFDYAGDNEGTAAKLMVTGIERTLIDIVVRPSYAGGVHEVLKAYQNARDLVSVNRLAATLQKLSYTYPYHQAIGFYLERAGYNSAQLDLLRRFPMEFDFYLTHQTKEKEYVKEWRLYVPKRF